MNRNQHIKSSMLNALKEHARTFAQHLGTLYPSYVLKGRRRFDVFAEVCGYENFGQLCIQAEVDHPKLQVPVTDFHPFEWPGFKDKLLNIILRWHDDIPPEAVYKACAMTEATLYGTEKPAYNQGISPSLKSAMVIPEYKLNRLAGSLFPMVDRKLLDQLSRTAQFLSSPAMIDAQTRLMKTVTSPAFTEKMAFQSSELQKVFQAAAKLQATPSMKKMQDLLGSDSFKAMNKAVGRLHKAFEGVQDVKS